MRKDSLRILHISQENAIIKWLTDVQGLCLGVRASSREIGP